MTTENRASLNPDTYEEGSAIPSGNLRVKESRFAVFDYMGKAERPAFTLRWNLENMETGETSTQHYSAGDPTKIQPSDDGKEAILVGGTGFPRSSNMAFLTTELINAGFPQDKMGLGADVFDGLEATFVVKPQPKRSGLVRAEGARELVITVPVAILKLPWDANSTSVGATETTVATDSAVTGGVEAKVLEFVRKYVAKQGGSITKNALGALGFQELADEPDKNDMVSFIFGDGFDALMAGNGLKVDGDNITQA